MYVIYEENAIDKSRWRSFREKSCFRKIELDDKLFFFFENPLFA